MKFRLRTLLIGIALVAVALFLLVVAPPALATPTLATIWASLAGFLAAGIVFGRHKARAFCIGAMFPVGGTAFVLSWMLFVWVAGASSTRSFERTIEEFERVASVLRMWSAIGWPMTVLAGLAAIAGRGAMAPKIKGKRLPNRRPTSRLERPSPLWRCIPGGRPRRRRRDEA